MLIAPDCFGDSLTALEAASAIADGWYAARPRDEVILAPQSDGGPGFVRVLAARDAGLQVRRTPVDGPLTGTVAAEWLFDQRTATAYLECAQACGLSLLGGPPTAETAMAAHSRGVGRLIEAALEQDVRCIVVGLGGSSCTDGGRGMVAALGGLDEARSRLAGVRLISASDVENPLLGERGAARVFGPQKGADPDTVDLLERRLAAWADELEASKLGADAREVRGLPGAGAAGGLGAALLSLGAQRVSGAALIAERTGLSEDLASADLLVTGEGRLDAQTLGGKVVGTLAGMAGAARPGGVPVVVLAGQVGLAEDESGRLGLAATHSLAEFCGSAQRAIEEAAEQLRGLAERVAAGLVRE